MTSRANTNTSNFSLLVMLDNAIAALEAALAANPESARVKKKLDQLNVQKENPATATVTPDDALTSKPVNP